MKYVTKRFDKLSKKYTDKTYHPECKLSQTWWFRTVFYQVYPRLSQHVNQPTRSRIGQSDSILDLVISSEEDMIGDIKYLEPLGKSDHCVLQFVVKNSVTIQCDIIHKLLYDKANIEGMLNESVANNLFLVDGLPNHSVVNL